MEPPAPRPAGAGSHERRGGSNHTTQPSQHSHGMCLGPAHEVGAWRGSRGSVAVGWGGFPAASRQWDLPAGGPGLLPGRVIVQIPPCRCSLPPFPPATRKGCCSRAPFPPTGRLRGRKGTGGRWQGQARLRGGVPARLTSRGVMGWYCSTSERAVGTTSRLHGAGREPAAAVGLPGHAGDPLVPARLKDMHAQCPVSTSDWLSPEANFEDLRQSQQLGRRLQCHKQPGDATQGGSPFFFFPMQEPGASRARTGEQGQSKGRRRLVHCVGNPGHSSSQGATDAKILPEFRETREIHGLKNHQALLSAMAVLQRAARAAPSRAGRACWGLCTPCTPAPATYLPAGRKASPWHRGEVQL